MDDSEKAVDAAHSRLMNAIARLETAAGASRSEAAGDATGHARDAAMQRMTADRSRLARELDAALVRAERLDTANREVSHRLVEAMEQVRTVLGRMG